MEQPDQASSAPTDRGEDSRAGEEPGNRREPLALLLLLLLVLLAPLLYDLASWLRRGLR